MAVKSTIGSLRLGNLGVDILCSEDQGGATWYRASVPKMYSRGNRRRSVKSLRGSRFLRVLVCCSKPRKNWQSWKRMNLSGNHGAARMQALI